MRARAVGSGSIPRIRPRSISSAIFAECASITGSMKPRQARRASSSAPDASASARSRAPWVAYSSASRTSASRAPVAMSTPGSSRGAMIASRSAASGSTRRRSRS